jgi:hypothetical protein
MPVKRDRSISLAPAGTLVPTLRMRSPSNTTTAPFKTPPLPSIRVPKRIAVVAADASMGGMHSTATAAHANRPLVRIMARDDTR